MCCSIFIRNVFCSHIQQDGLLSDQAHVDAKLYPTPTVNGDLHVRGLVMFPLCPSFCHYYGLLAVSIHTPPVSTHLQFRAR